MRTKKLTCRAERTHWLHNLRSKMAATPHSYPQH